MSFFTCFWRSLLSLSLFSVSALAVAICNVNPTYNSDTGKITIPCIDVISTKADSSKTYSVQLQQREGSAYVFDLDLNKVNQVTSTTAYQIGNKGPAGGIVFYVDQTGLHGLESQPHDANVGGNTYDSFSGNTYDSFNGKAHFYTWTEAKTIANSYGSDWHLPTKDELQLLYQQYNVVGNFYAYGNYWSSTEYNANNAWIQSVLYGDQYYFDKTIQLLVRAVRAF